MERSERPLRLLMLDVAGPAVARAACGPAVGACCAAVRLAGFVHGAFDAQPLHVLVGRYFGVDVVALDHQGQRHADDEQPDGRDGAKYDDQPGWHGMLFFTVRNLGFPGQMYTFVR